MSKHHHIPQGLLAHSSTTEEWTKGPAEHRGAHGQHQQRDLFCHSAWSWPRCTEAYLLHDCRRFTTQRYFSQNLRIQACNNRQNETCNDKGGIRKEDGRAILCSCCLLEDMKQDRQDALTHQKWIFEFPGRMHPLLGIAHSKHTSLYDGCHISNKVRKQRVHSRVSSTRIKLIFICLDLYTLAGTTQTSM
jgi:hypothetical protein